MKRRTLLIATLCGVLALAGAGVVMAQQSGETEGTSFLDRVAAKLGIDRPRLDQALKDARTEEIDEAVASGDLSQERADRLKERIDDLPPGEGFGHAWGRGKFNLGPNGHGFGERFNPGFGLGDMKAGLAEFLGVSEEQLRDELAADDATLASVAAAHGKSRDELKAFIQSETKAALDEAVANGTLTQERADNIAANLAERLDAVIDAECGGMKPFFKRGMPFGDMPDGTPGGEMDLHDFAPAFRS